MTGADVPKFAYDLVRGQPVHVQRGYLSKRPRSRACQAEAKGMVNIAVFGFPAMANETADEHPTFPSTIFLRNMMPTVDTAFVDLADPRSPDVDRVAVQLLHVVFRRPQVKGRT